MKLSTHLLTMFVLLIACASALAQTATSSLRGKATDPSGALVVGATVTLESKETGFHQVHKTDKDGSYQFQQVPPATYSVTVANTGFRRRLRSSASGVATRDPQLHAAC